MKLDLRDIQARGDRALVLAFSVVLATASASTATVLAARPQTQSVRTIDVPVVQVVSVPQQAPRDTRPVSPDAARSALLGEHRCLTEAMYYEARGEGEIGEKAVAEVIFHRMRDGNYGNSICAVVHEGAARGQCQFSFVCDGSRDRPKSAVAWREAEVLAARLLTGEECLNDDTGGATNYHADYIRPVWASKLVRTAQIGNHIFYRTASRENLKTALRQSIW